jgi:type II secretory pathway component PulF
MFIPGSLGEWAGKRYKTSRMSRDQQIEFLRYYADLSSEGFKTRKVLEALEREFSKAIGEKAEEVLFCREALEKVEEGTTGIDDAMRDWFEPDLVQVLRVSTVSRNASVALNQLLEQVSLWEKVMGEIMSALRKPVSMILMTVGATLFISIKGIGALAGDTPKADWTEMAILYDDFGLWVVANYKVITLVCAWVVVIYIYSMLKLIGEHRRTLDTIVPGYGLYQANQAARFFTIMAVLVSPNGGKMRMRTALEEFENNADLMSDYLFEHIQEMLDRCETGRFSTEQLNTGLLPLRMQIRLGVAASTTDGLSMADAFNTISRNLAKDYGQTMVTKISRAMNLVKAVVAIAVVGAVSAGMDGVFSRMEHLMY